MITTMLYHIALILFLAVMGFDAAAWFSAGMILMFWFTVVILAKGADNESFS
jgi:hypothetical protein